MKYLTIILLTAMVMQSCNTTKNTSILWVSGQKTDCTAGAGKMKCLTVHKGDDLSNPSWENFYANIDGFNFEEGYLQKIKVKEEQLDLKNVPADASSIKYTLVKVLDKQQDFQLLLNGSWTPQRINDNPINRKVPLPKLVIDVSQKRISGTDGCNNYSAEIVNLTPSKMELGNVASTKKMCMDMSITDVYNKALNNIATYQIEDENLVFYDLEGNEVLSFMKAKASIAQQNLHDIWITVRINGNPINRMVTIPRMELNLTEMRIMGNNGCNDYSGAIERATNKILSFGNIASTKKMCPNMGVPDSFDAALIKVSKYERDGLNLKLFDKDGNEVLAFLKGD